MDGSGNQINISTRGLDPHRGWEFNIRKDGVVTNSDMYGYPASHYSMPMEAIQNIELVRGTVHYNTVHNLVECLIMWQNKAIRLKLLTLKAPIA